MDKEPELGDKCPKCKQGELLLIVYGYPTEAAEESAKKGDILLGGCCITDNDPTFGCKQCGAKFGGKKEWLRYRKLKKLFGFLGVRSMDGKKAEQTRLIELDKQYLELKERDCMLAGQLKEYSTQQGIMGLKVCNIEKEMELLEDKIADVQKEKADVCKRIEKTRNRKGKSKR